MDVINFAPIVLFPMYAGEISRPVEAIVKEVTDLGVVKGFEKEITLLGQKCKLYGLDFKEDGTDFGTLVDALMVFWYRTTYSHMTSHPQDICLH